MAEGTDIFGNPTGTNIHGNPSDTNVQGERPENAQGNTAKDIFGNDIGSQEEGSA